MPITDKQRDRRAAGLGSSDMPAVMGVSPWATRKDVWLEKLGKVTPRTETEWMRQGNLLEGAILNWAESQLGPIRRNQNRRAPVGPIRANIDAILLETGEPIEAKLCDFRSPLFTDFGEDGTDEVPEYVIVQAHCHMIACRPQLHPEKCHVPVLLGGRFVMYEVPLNFELENAIVAESIAFWHHVKKKTEPGDGASMDLIRRLIRVPGKRVEVDIADVQAWFWAKEAAKVAKGLAEEYKAIMLNSLGDAEVGMIDGEDVITYMETERKGFTVQPTRFPIARITRVGKTLSGPLNPHKLEADDAEDSKGDGD